ncbi:MAG: HAMP domain-containing histidine kinase [Clostridia bacterium]|nr:HAMP domain-containing histidine kinase [Clostridia bacterium]
MRSIFVRYLTAFAVIILVSFLMLTSIVSVSIDNYAVDEQRSDAERITEITAAMLENAFATAESDSFSDFVAETDPDTVPRIFDLLSTHTKNASFFIANANGHILFSYVRTPGIDDSITEIPTVIVQQLIESGTFSEYGKMGGRFSSNHLVSALPIYDGDRQIVGSVFVCSADVNANALISVLNKSIMLANLWIMLAVMVAAYFITERLTNPIKEIRHAAREFAKGNFEPRIQVVGDDEISDLALTFNQMADSLAKSENLRSSFLANVSHDLRTPMTSIAGYIDGIRSGAIPPEKQNHYLGIVSSEIQRLSRLVNQLLDLSRMEAGMRQFNPSEFDICELARLILISFESKIEEKHLEIEFDTEEDRMPVFADRDAMHQILYNLCDNAIKFSYDGGLLRISIRSGEKGKYTITIYNEGSGIPKDDLPYIFDRFYKSDKSRGLDKIGVGLGLYIVKTMLVSSGESIRAESEEGKNCAFIFSVKRSV